MQGAIQAGGRAGGIPRQRRNRRGVEEQLQHIRRERCKERRVEGFEKATN